MSYNWWSFNHALKTIWKNECVALMTRAGDIISAHGFLPSGYGGLGVITRTVDQYFALKPGAVVVQNDPYAGGNTLSHPTLIAPLWLSKSEKPELYVITRFTCGWPSLASKSIAEEGLRIPPTPICDSHFEVMRPILEMASQAPGCPEHFDKNLLSAVDKLKNYHHQANVILEHFDIKTIKTIQSYLNFCAIQYQLACDDFPNGEHDSSLSTDQGDRLSLNTKVSDNGITFEVSGISSKTEFNFTESDTLGIAARALDLFLGVPLSFSQGLYQTFGLAAPAKSAFHARAPLPRSPTIAIGDAWLMQLFLKNLSQMCPNKSVSGIASPAIIQIQKESRVYSWIEDGGCAVNYLGQPIVYLPEFPTPQCPLIKPVRNSRRFESGGKGLHAGRDGVIKSWQALEDFTLYWNSQNTIIKPESVLGGNVGDVAQLFTTAHNEQSLETRKPILVKAGETVTLLTAGAGGWGRNERNKDDD